MPLAHEKFYKAGAFIAGGGIVGLVAGYVLRGQTERCLNRSFFPPHEISDLALHADALSGQVYAAGDGYCGWMIGNYNGSSDLVTWAGWIVGAALAGIGYLVQSAADRRAAAEPAARQPP